jgi:hypothetical protein
MMLERDARNMRVLTLSGVGGSSGSPKIGPAKLFGRSGRGRNRCFSVRDRRGGKGDISVDTSIDIKASLSCCFWSSSEDLPFFDGAGAAVISSTTASSRGAEMTFDLEGVLSAALRSEIHWLTRFMLSCRRCARPVRGDFGVSSPANSHGYCSGLMCLRWL